MAATRDNDRQLPSPHGRLNLVYRSPPGRHRTRRSRVGLG
jgi:hypothetical protein